MCDWHFCDIMMRLVAKWLLSVSSILPLISVLNHHLFLSIVGMLNSPRVIKILVLRFGNTLPMLVLVLWIKLDVSITTKCNRLMWIVWKVIFASHLPMPFWL